MCKKCRRLEEVRREPTRLAFAMRIIQLSGIRGLSIALILILQLVLSVNKPVAYEENVHYELTRFLAVSAGLKDDIAFEIARADQGTDEDPATSPWSYTARKMYHFVTALLLQNDCLS